MSQRGWKILKAGRVYKTLRVKGKTVILRVMNWDDTDRLLAFMNELADDKASGRSPEVFTGFERKFTRSEEAEWVVTRMVQIVDGDMVSILAEVGKRIVANGEVTRGGYAETRHHGRLALTVTAAYRGLGIGRAMVEVLVREGRRIGLKNLEVEFLATNQAAIHTYETAGFREVGRIPGKVLRKGRLLDSVIMTRKLL